MDQNQKPSEPLWQVIKTFHDEEAGIIIVVKRQLLPVRHENQIPRPIFSFDVCRLSDVGETVRYFGVLTDLDLETERVSLRRPFDTETLARLIHEAEYWILGECQAHVDEVAAAKRAHIARTGPKRDELGRLPGLKTLVKRDREKGGYRD